MSLFRYAGLADPELRNASKPRRVVYVVRTLFEALVLGTPVVAAGSMVSLHGTESLGALVPFGTMGNGMLVMLIAGSLVMLVGLHVFAMILGSLADALVHAGAVVKLAASGGAPTLDGVDPRDGSARFPTSERRPQNAGYVAVAVLTVIVVSTGLLSLGAISGVWTRLHGTTAGTADSAEDQFSLARLGSQSGTPLRQRSRTPNAMPRMATRPSGANRAGSDSCRTATAVSIPTTLEGSLEGAQDDSNDRIEQSGYNWSGPDIFYAINLTAGQTISLTLDDHFAFDGGLYIFQNCSDIPGSTVAGRDTVSGGPAMTFTASDSGRYIVAVDSFVAGSTGPFTLAIH